VILRHSFYFQNVGHIGSGRDAVLRRAAFQLQKAFLEFVYDFIATDFDIEFIFDFILSRRPLVAII
jgi:hypothetical protein